MPVKKNPKQLQISCKELKQLQKRIAKRKLAPDDWQLVQAMTEAVERLSLSLAERDTSLGRLCKYLFGAPTETAKNLLKHRPKAEANKPDRPPPKGHGSNGAAAYTGAGKVVIDHPELKAGEGCPLCTEGKVYELAMPAVRVQVVGEAPLKATVFEYGRLRCNRCGEVFTPQIPAEITEKTYDESAAAMLGLLKYGCGLPLNRIERLQQSLGQPLPASTQWDVLNATAVSLSPVHDTLIDLAAQGEVIHNDDTTMKVLSYIKEQDPTPAPARGSSPRGWSAAWMGARSRSS